MVFVNDRQRRAVMGRLKDKIVTFRVPAQSEQVSVRDITFDSMERLSAKAGYNWFDTDIMDSIRTQLHGRPFVSDKGNIYFISSVKSRIPLSERRYSIQEFNPRSGAVGTIGKLHKYADPESAKKVMENLE